LKFELRDSAAFWPLTSTTPREGSGEPSGGDPAREPRVASDANEGRVESARAILKLRQLNPAPPAEISANSAGKAKQAQGLRLIM
jgi:hypothetical protein